MAKLTLSFKNRFLRLYHVEPAAPLVIGRDPDCIITIDSLAIAPHHAEFVNDNEQVVVRALDPGYPVLVNGIGIKDQATLRHGDTVTIGKHALTYADDAQDLHTSVPAIGTEVEDNAADLPAYVQIQSGPQIGRVIVMEKSVTPLNVGEGKEVVIARRGKSYHLHRIGADTQVKVEKQALEAHKYTQLRNASLIEIDDVRFQFFTG